MIRALYTAASGMNAQQANIDNVAHNLANVNTTGFKKSRVEFEDLVYQQIKAPGTPTSQEARSADRPRGRPRLARGGDRAQLHAAATCARPARRSTWPSKAQGFFQVTLPGGETGYTRAGTFHLNGQGAGGDQRGLSARAGRSPFRANATSITISKDGIVSVTLPGQGAPQQVGTIELAQFQNPAGLEARGGNIFVVDHRLGRSDRRACPAPTGSARWRRASSRTRTSASSRRWST